MFMALRVIAKPVNESETIKSTWCWVQHYLCLAMKVSHCRVTTWHHVQNSVLCLGQLEKTTKEPKLPNSDTSLLPWRQHSGNRLKWLRGHPCRALQTCLPIPAKHLRYFLTGWDMEGAHLEMSEHWGVTFNAHPLAVGYNSEAWVKQVQISSLQQIFSVTLATGKHLHWS